MTYDEVMASARRSEAARAEAHQRRERSSVSEDVSRRQYRAQKAALTRAGKVGERGSEERRRAVVMACVKALGEWSTWRYGWPDDWSRWQRALDDAFPVFQAPSLEDLR